MVHFGLKLIDEHAARCSEVLCGLPEARGHVEESVDYLRSQWISYSVRKQETMMQKVGAGGSMRAAGNEPNRTLFVGESSSGVPAVSDVKSALLRVEAGKLVFKNIDAPRKKEREEDSPGELGEGWASMNNFAEMEQESVLTPQEKFFATPADPLVTDSSHDFPHGPPVFDATPTSAARVAEEHEPFGLVAGDAVTGIDEDFDEPEVPSDSAPIVVPTHSVFGSSPFDLGLGHAKTPASVCRFLVKMLDKTDAVEAQNC